MALMNRRDCLWSAVTMSKSYTQYLRQLIFTILPNILGNKANVQHG